MIVGIVNVTPDSFSDGGEFLDPNLAISHGIDLRRAGADLVDVGGESTRPGAEPVDAGTETERVIPVVEGLVEADVPVSVDTSKAEVARSALAAGALAVNDVTALRDPDMAEVISSAGAGLVLMHMQGEPATMQNDPQYDDVTKEVAEFLSGRAELAEESGVDREAICLDPGIGFGKLYRHNLELLGRLDEVVALGYPVMIGTSRKGFLGRMIGQPSPSERDVATAATIALSVAKGAFAVRVHNVAVSRDAARVAHAIVHPHAHGE